MSDVMTPSEELGRIKEALKPSEALFPGLVGLSAPEMVSRLISTTKGLTSENQALRASLSNGGFK